MAGFTILKDNSSLNDILKVEGVCPCCDTYPTRYYETHPKIHNKREYRQFKYHCPECNSEWLGNLYDNNLNMIETKNTFFRKVGCLC